MIKQQWLARRYWNESREISAAPKSLVMRSALPSRQTQRCDKEANPSCKSGVHIYLCALKYLLHEISESFSPTKMQQIGQTVPQRMATGQANPNHFIAGFHLLFPMIPDPWMTAIRVDLRCNDDFGVQPSVRNPVSSGGVRCCTKCLKLASNDVIVVSTHSVSHQQLMRSE